MRNREIKDYSAELCLLILHIQHVMRKGHKMKKKKHIPRYLAWCCTRGPSIVSAAFASFDFTLQLINRITYSEKK